MPMKNLFQTRPGPAFMLLLLVLVFAGCEPDYIDVRQANYVIGGPGTSGSRGAVEFRFNFSGWANPDEFVDVALYPGVGIIRVHDSGSRIASFGNLLPGFYNYELQNWDFHPNFGISSGVSFGGGSGGWTSTYSTYYSGPSYDRDFLAGTLEIRPNETLIIDIDL